MSKYLEVDILNMEKGCRFCLGEDVSMVKIPFDEIKQSEIGMLYEFVTKIEVINE